MYAKTVLIRHVCQRQRSLTEQAALVDRSVRESCCLWCGRPWWPCGQHLHLLTWNCPLDLNLMWKNNMDEQRKWLLSTSRDLWLLNGNYKWKYETQKGDIHKNDYNIKPERYFCSVVLSFQDWKFKYTVVANPYSPLTHLLLLFRSILFILTMMLKWTPRLSPRPLALRGRSLLRVMSC